MEAKWAAYNYAWAATNERMGPQSDVAQNKLDAEEHMENMGKRSQGLLSGSDVDHFKWLAFNAGWHAANDRYGYKTDAAKDRKNMDEHRDALFESSVLGSSLVENLYQLCFNAAWYTANERYGYTDDAKTNRAYFDSYAEKIGGEVVLTKVDFDIDEAKTMGTKPLVVASQTLANAGDVDQSMSFTYSASEGSTKGWSHTVGFSVGVSTTVGADFVFASAETTFSFETSYSGSWTGEASEGTEKTYTYPLVVPPHTTYKAKATVHEVNMEVPYTMTLSIGGNSYTIDGMWTGVAVSTATYTVEPVSDLDLVMLNLQSSVVGNSSLASMVV